MLYMYANVYGYTVEPLLVDSPSRRCQPFIYKHCHFVGEVNRAILCCGVNKTRLLLKVEMYTQSLSSFSQQLMATAWLWNHKVISLLVNTKH